MANLTHKKKTEAEKNGDKGRKTQKLMNNVEYMERQWKK